MNEHVIRSDVTFGAVCGGDVIICDVGNLCVTSLVLSEAVVLTLLSTYCRGLGISMCSLPSFLYTIHTYILIHNALAEHRNLSMYQEKSFCLSHYMHIHTPLIMYWPRLFFKT